MEKKKKSILDEIINKKVIVINDMEGKPIELFPIYLNYTVPNMIGGNALIPALGFMTNVDGEHVPFGILTKCFGEFIGMKNTAYIDTNNMPFANQLLEMGIARNTGWKKRSGFCEYPLWEFDERFLTVLGGKEYKAYSECFDKIMNCDLADDENEETEDIKMDM